MGTVRLGVRLAGKTTAIGKSAAAGQTADDGPTADHGPAAAIEEAADSGSPRPRPPVRSRSTYLRAGRGFARLTTVPPLLVIAWLLPAIPLLAAGRPSYLPWFSYLLSGGVNLRSFFPGVLTPAVRAADTILQPLDPLFAIHWHITVRKTPDGNR